MNAFVTGATGFTGGHLARALASGGHHVRALVRAPARPGADTRSLTGAGVHLVEGDLDGTGSLRSAVEGADVIFNIAALYRQAGLPDATYHRVNAEAPARLVRAAAEAGVRRVVHCSTVGVHGDVEHPPAAEDAPLRPGDVYQVTKLEGERLARAAAEGTGVELVIVRPTGIYGPGDRRLLKLFRGVARRRFVVLGNGEIFYHLTYIDDLVEGFRLAATVPAAAGRTYILAGGEVTTLNALVALIAEEAGVPPPRLRLPVWPFRAAGAACEAVCRPLGVEPPIYRRRVDFFTKSRAFDIRRARAELGFAPAVGLREGVRRTLAWYRQEGWILMPGDIPRAQDQLFAPGLSARQKYARLIVGREGWTALIGYEAVQLLSQWVPGALGLALRKALYPRLLGACGRNVVFGQHVVLRHPHKIRIGDDVVVDDNCLLDAKGDTNAGITIGSGVFLGRNTILSCKNGDIVIGEGANLGFNCELFSAARVELGANALLAAYCYVIGGDHDWKDAGRPVLEQGRRAAGVRLGDGAWLGAGVKVLDGVDVGDGAIIGAGAVVNSAIPAQAIAVGVPAKVIGARG